MLLVTLLSAVGRRTGLDLLWRVTALGLAAAALLLAWIVRPRTGVSADTVLAAALTTVAALLAAAALAGRAAPRHAAALTPSRAPSATAARSGWIVGAPRAA